MNQTEEQKVQIKREKLRNTVRALISNQEQVAKLTEKLIAAQSETTSILQDLVDCLNYNIEGRINEKKK